MYLRLNTQFNPFTYDELVKPLADYGKAYKEAEDVYTTLSSQTEAFKDMVNQNINSEAYNMYKGYSDDLNKALDDFSKGMTSSNRSKLLELKKRYAGEIIPIAKASEALKEANALRDKAGPDAIFEVGRYKSLDDFLHGKVANNRYQSASALTSKTATITEAAMKEALQDPEFKKVLGNQQYMITQHTGGSYEDLMAAIANNPVAQNKFAEIKRQVMEDAGYENYDDYGKAAIENAINTGLYAGLDKPVRQFEANKNHPSPELLERQRQFDIGLKMRGYDSKGNVDPDNPYWKTQGLEYDKENKTWKVVGKPGTNSTGKTGTGSSASTKINTPTYDKIRIKKYDGTIQLGVKEGEGIRGKKVDIVPDNNEIKLKIGDITIGTYDAISKKISIEEPEDIEGVSWDKDYDNINAKSLTEDIVSIIEREGLEGLKYYDFYLDLDNSSNNNEDGSSTIVPLKRVNISKEGEPDDSKDLK